MPQVLPERLPENGQLVVQCPVRRNAATARQLLDMKIDGDLVTVSVVTFRSFPFFPGSGDARCPQLPFLLFVDDSLPERGDNGVFAGIHQADFLSFSKRICHRVVSDRSLIVSPQPP